MQSIRDGSYTPSPVRRKEIPKPDGGIAKAGNPNGSRPGDSTGNRTEAAGYLGAAVFGQQLWIPSETERPADNPTGKGKRRAGLQICGIGGLVEVF